jgi:NADH-quinone oxidoreductase subunit D
MLDLEGETVVDARPVIGYLHRGTEKLAEDKTYQQVIPLIDRLDYLACPAYNFAYCLAVEKLLGIEVPHRAQYIRVIMAELARIASHLIWLGSHAMDIGAVTVFLYTFREREVTYELLEMAAGVRMHQSYFVVGGVRWDLPDGFVEKLKAFLDIFPKKIKEYENLLTKNKIWKLRTVGVGLLSREDAIACGVTGPMLRGSGVKWDIRKAYPYSGYEQFEFEVPTGERGDTYDRYLVRMEEMRQSREIILQALEKLPEGPIHALEGKLFFPDPELVRGVHKDMAALIHQFKLVSEGFHAPEGEIYQSIEAPKGELGFYIVGDGGPKPFRLRIRLPSLMNLQSLPLLSKGHKIADMAAIIGTLDIVLGDVDK